MDTRTTIPDDGEALRYHGGNINAARRLFPDAPEPWIDLSTGINATPYPVGTVAASMWTRLPELSEIAELEQAAHVAYGAGPSAGIVAAPGTQALIQWLPRLFPARRVGVLGFTYTEHEKCWRQAGADVTAVKSASELVNFDTGIVVNPNNPDGRTVPADDLVWIARALAQLGGQLIVDEAFMDVHHGSLVPHLPVCGAVVLRSFGKVYGLAGLRLGFAVSSPEVCARLRSAFGPWAVSGPAIEIGRRAFMDSRWLAATVQRLGDGACRLDGLLQAAGIEVVGGTNLFRLARHKDAAGLFSRLCLAGILTRPFQAQPDWLRFGIPGGPAEWERLDTALRAYAADP
jgi:cobalamin biosynthetic protein CobC